jgi:hypothetical protein
MAEQFITHSPDGARGQVAPATWCFPLTTLLPSGLSKRQLSVITKHHTPYAVTSVTSHSYSVGDGFVSQSGYIRDNISEETMSYSCRIPANDSLIILRCIFRNTDSCWQLLPSLDTYWPSRLLTLCMHMGVVEVQLHSFLTSTLDEGKQSVWRPGRPPAPRGRNPCTPWIWGCVGPGSGLKVLEKNVSSTCRD